MEYTTMREMRRIEKLDAVGTVRAAYEAPRVDITVLAGGNLMADSGTIDLPSDPLTSES